MAETLRVAALQMNTGADPDENLKTALDLIDQAATGGAEAVALPETWNYMGPSEDTHAHATTIPGPLTDALAVRARQHGIVIHGGSLYERRESDPLLSNTTVLINRDGRIVSQYRKIHMFDVSFEDHFSFRESAIVRPGAEIVTSQIDEIPVGLTICYDLRFPELFRELALRGARVIFLPAAFTQHTGKDHWEVLIRARAIENQCFMVAPAQFGQHPDGSVTYGRAMIVDPWGVVLAQAPGGPGLAIAELNFDALERMRRELPSLKNRQPEVYASSEGIAAR